MIQLTDIQPVPIKETTNGIRPDSQIFATRVAFEKKRRHLVIAPSGKGKSTLLHILYGLRNDYEGDVFYDQKNIRDLSPDEWSEYRQTKLSIVFQDLRLFPRLSALDNLLLKTALTPVKSETDLRKMAARLGVEGLLDKKAQTLSYGQRQRFAILRALCQPFEYLLLDEPFSHLDEENTAAACALIEEELDARDAALIMVSLGEKYGFRYDKELIL
ncbi:MAG: ATP-binding cassette domain-containing protein [Bacteroidetes bacterium]|nr:MAG: ATP-binding cassette domain-containing protein [Bacteroidota bacterium]